VVKLLYPLKVVVNTPAAFLERTVQKYRVAAINPLTETLRFVPVEIVGKQPEVIAMQY
jgi:hypothetical protein